MLAIAIKFEEKYSAADDAEAIWLTSKSMSQHKLSENFLPLSIAVLTVSDTRTEETDTSGLVLIQRLQDEGHRLRERRIVKDDIYQLRAVVSTWIASSQVQVILITGGTGFTARDNTPQAIEPLLDKVVDGFGELFRQVSYEDIGTSTIQSRALAGLANGTVIFCMPGSPGACRTAWDRVIKEQLDVRHKPCNFVGLLKEPERITGSENGRIDKCEPRS